MLDAALGSITSSLLATGLAAGTTVGARKVQNVLRKRQISEAIGDVATEFNKALKEAIEEEAARSDSGELANLTADWPAIAEALASSEAAPDQATRREHEEISILFEDEAAAVAELAEAIGSVNDRVGAAMAADPDVRSAVETALTRAYRQAVADFERRVAANEELRAVFEAETDLVLAERLDALGTRLETLAADVENLLTQEIRNEGFQQLSPVYFDRASPSPEACWRTTFTLSDVYAGIPAPRSGHDPDSTARDELLEALWHGEDRIVVGRPGAGKSTLCKRVAVEWYRAEAPGAVIYRESGRGGRQFESTGALTDAIEAAESPTLVVVEDAVRPAATAIFDVMEAFQGDPSVRFLLDARQSDIEAFEDDEFADATDRRHGELLETVSRYQLPAISEADVAAFIEAFETATGRAVSQQPSSLHADVTGGAADEFGAFLLLSFHLPVAGDRLDGGGAETGLEAHVRARVRTLEEPGRADALRDLSGFDPDLLADVGVMVNLLNAAGIGIHPELVHALAFEHGPTIDTTDDIADICAALERTHDEIAEIRAALEGWFLYPTGSEEGPVRTTHELWSTLYLRQVAQEHQAEAAERRRRARSERRVGRCLQALFDVCDEAVFREALAFEFPGSSVLGSMADDPETVAAEYAHAVFRLGTRWPVLAPLFGTSRTARYDLPDALPETTRAWVVTSRGTAHRKRGAYAAARSEYERRLEEAQRAEDRDAESIALNNLGLVSADQGEYDLAWDYHERSLELKRELGDTEGIAVTLNNLGRTAYHQGDDERAWEYLKRSLDMKEELGDPKGVAVALNNLGLVAHRQEAYDQAREYHQRGLSIKRDLGDRYGQSVSLNNLGNVAKSQDAYDEAQEYYHQSLELKRELGDRDGEARVLRNLGSVARYRDQLDRARDYYQQSLELERELGDPENEATVRRNLGRVARRQGELERAREQYQQWLAVARELDDRDDQAQALGMIGIVSQDLGEYGRAREALTEARDLFQERDRPSDELRARRYLIEVDREAGNTADARKRCAAASERIEAVEGDVSDEREELQALCAAVREETAGR
ncbi:MAG: tetratricopeptide repeat protein [Halobacteriaceae archaeon]